MASLINASIDVTLLLEMAQKKHTAFNRSAKNQHVYANLSIWVNDEPDQYGDHASIQLNSAKDGVAKDKLINPKQKEKCYIGRGKKANFGPQPLAAGESTGLPANTDFFGGGAPAGNQQSAPQQGNPWDNQAPNGGLPF